MADLKKLLETKEAKILELTQKLGEGSGKDSTIKNLTQNIEILKLQMQNLKVNDFEDANKLLLNQNKELQAKQESMRV